MLSSFLRFGSLFFCFWLVGCAGGPSDFKGARPASGGSEPQAENGGAGGGNPLEQEPGIGGFPQGGTGGSNPRIEEPPEEEPPQGLPIRQEAARLGYSFTNKRGEEILATLFLPIGKPPFPGVLVLHGSGGLFDEPEDGNLLLNPNTFDPSRAPLESQFARWAALLVEEGFAVMLPASFASRGYYDWNKTPPEGVSKKDRLIFRTHDALAAQSALCSHEEIECKSMAAIGISDGGTTLLTATSAQLRNIAELNALAPPLPAQDFKIAIAYYPGCFLHGLIPTGPEDGYLPRIPLHIFHGDADPLLEHCPRREEQAANESQRLGQPNPFGLHIFNPNVGHGFDSSPENEQEELAKTQAQTLTLELFKNRLMDSDL